MGYFDKSIAKYFLDSAQSYADENSTCCKVKVGSCIISSSSTGGMLVIYGCNHGVNDCKKNGCRRIKLYGDASKEHRLPSDCDALHSEIDAICATVKNKIVLDNAEMYITRYPCEACARAIAASGIKKVIYGRKESISNYTAQILNAADVIIAHADFWEREDNNE